MKPILVTGVGGNVGGIGQKIVELLLKNSTPVRALFRKQSDLSDHFSKLGVEVTIGNLNELTDIHRALDGVERLYFGMAVSDQYLQATVNVAAVAKHVGVQAFVNMSQMTVSQMSITETTPSPQQKLYWLSEQVLNWSGLPVAHIRPTAFLENPLFSHWTIASIRERNEIPLPFGMAKTSPIAAIDVATAIGEILLAPQRHLGKVYELTGRKSQNMDEFAKECSLALGRKITYLDLPYDSWKEKFLSTVGKLVSGHVASHLTTMALLHRENRYDRSTEDFKNITGKYPMSVEDWVASRRADFREISR
jgi:uncharacterized protein YbjT (DUF2867 family)